MLPKKLSYLLGICFFTILAAVAGAILIKPQSSQAATLPSGFTDSVVFSGLINPTNFRFASDGRVFVAEKRGVIKVFDNLQDTTPTIFADLRTNVYNFWDRGLLGIALDPNFPTKPYIYVLYTYDAAIGGQAPRWGVPGTDDDGCPSPPGPTTNGCVVSGRLSRLQASGNVMTGVEQVLIEDWCQQFPSHSIGDLAFGPDGALYATGGDGASFGISDYGQTGSPLNPCGDPPGGVGASLTPPTAEGGALRSQDLRTPSDPTGLNGSVIRVNPDTGAGLTDNPLSGSSDPNAKRIIAYGLRNPFRFTIKPNSNEIWIGDVGWGDWEEINRIDNPTGAVKNFGWPCYEGVGHQSGYDGAGLDICKNLYAQSGAVTAPFHTYHHNAQVIANENCPVGSSSISGLSFQFYAGGKYPAKYNGALFFADYSRNCIWAMLNGSNNLPNPSNIENFVTAAASPVNLQVSPDGELYYVDLNGGTVRKISYVGTYTPPVCSTGQFATEYFNNTTLTGIPSLSQCEAAINYDWGSGSPGSGIGADNFSVRWKGKQNFNSGDYTFTSTSDDGIRVWVDGTILIDQWHDQSPTSYTAIRNMTSGEHEILVEYYEHGGGAVAKVSWQLTGGGTPGCSLGQYLAEYFNNTTLTGTPTFTRCETVINNDWGTSGPGSGLGVDNFSVRWTGTHPFTANTYNFTATGDDGIRAYVDSNQIINGWVDQAPATYTANLNMTSGNHNVKVEYYERGGGAVAKFNFASVTPPANDPPVPTITTPSTQTTWKVGDVINFSGSATDTQDGPLPASALTWTITLFHCPSTCHTHPIQSFIGISSGSFTTPDHEYPSYLELKLTAKDSTGAEGSTTVRLDPKTAILTLQSNPTGLQLILGSASLKTPFTKSVIIGSTNSLSAPSPQTLRGKTYTFSNWSDNGLQSHTLIAPATNTTYTATYNRTK
jgi:glucose/arabinose dehydrogenase